MTNRAQRRANQKAAKRNGSQPQASRSATDQAAFNHQADRVADGAHGEWIPGKVEAPSVGETTAAQTPQKRTRTRQGWFKLLSWILIVCSALAFLIVMWIPGLPLWAIITVSAVFAVGVLTLFIVRGNDKNPYLDENGTAV